MNELYELIANTITTQVPAIKWVAFWPGSHALTPEAQPLALPAVFIELKAEWQNMTNTVQTANVAVVLRLVSHHPGPQTGGAAGQAAAKQRLALMQNLYLALQGLRSEHVTAMRRSGQHLGTATHTLATDVLTFATHLADDQRPNRYLKATPGLTVAKTNH